MVGRMTKARSTKPQHPVDLATEPEPGTPLHYCLSVMRDESASPARRDRMAIAAVPFLHKRVIETGIKASRRAEAKRVAKTPRLGRSKVPTR